MKAGCLKLFFLIFSLSTIGLLFSANDNTKESTCTLASESALVLGDLDSKEYWVYLCGLTRNFNSFDERQNRAILNRLGQQNNLHIIVVQPQWRSAEFNDKLRTAGIDIPFPQCDVLIHFNE